MCHQLLFTVVDQMIFNRTLVLWVVFFGKTTIGEELYRSGYNKESCGMNY